jgi:hypothetical protein
MWIRKRRAVTRQWSTGIRNISNPLYLVMKRNGLQWSRIRQ